MKKSITYIFISYKVVATRNCSAFVIYNQNTKGREKLVDLLMRGDFTDYKAYKCG